jgi:NitT/TauT family transport system permease protein
MIRNIRLASSALRRAPFGLADVAVILGALVVIALVAKVGAGALVSFEPNKSVLNVDLDPRNLWYYAARSTLRMFIALSWSTVFALAYGYAAARSRRAERLLIPLLDILQSVPVLGFLSITVTGFIALFPGNLLGLELAAIFAIFTAQAWNMAFAFYQSLRSIPAQLDEAATSYRLSSWQRFVQLEVPSGMIGLVWNAMMSFGGGWFFLAASEAISVLNQHYTLPGVGSYVAAAILTRNMPALAWAVVAIAGVIVTIDQLFWKPIVAWSDRYRMEESAASSPPRSWVYDLVRASNVPAFLRRMWRPLGDRIGNALARWSAVRQRREPLVSDVTVDRIYNVVVIAAIVVLTLLAANFVIQTVGLVEVAKVIGLGFATFGRVMLLLVAATLIWTPIGVAIGFNPALARIMQPVVLFCASFPANFIFPFATLAFITLHVPINWGCILLMALGSQWYILFNTIAGAQSIPTELREMAADLHVSGWLKWKRLIIPGIFASWVTGALTASGGAWNASIVSEIVSWGSTTLTATGLGTYIADATSSGDWARITLGISVMSLFVVTVNGLLWRRLYRFAEERFAR